MKKIFIDTDIILDLFTKREPYYTYAAQLFTLVDTNKIKAFTSPVIFCNLHYILSKLHNKSKSLNYLRKLKTLVKILNVNEKIIELALSSEFKDFEDSAQYHAAIENNIEYIITRNIKDYKLAKINILTAEDFVRLYEI